jgi:hypothetical protein
MNATRARTVRCAPLLLAAAVVGGCDGPGLTAPEAPPGPAMQIVGEQHRALAALRRATARYHDIDAAIADGFILLHDCEVRPGEGAVGILYIHLGRYLDGIIDPASPDGLLYEPAPGGRLRLAAAELALPAALWTAADPPRFLGIPFQLEEEFGAFGLHVWLWKHNPRGMFAQAHPGISCGVEE